MAHYFTFVARRIFHFHSFFLESDPCNQAKRRLGGPTFSTEKRASSRRACKISKKLTWRAVGANYIARGHSKNAPTDKQNLIRCKQILTPTENPPAFVLFCSINWNSTIYTRITTFLLLRHQWRLHLFFHLSHIVKDLLQILLLLRTHFFQYKIACQKTQNRPPCNPNLNQPL